MAKQYVTAGSYQTVRVQSQTSVVDVELIGIYTKPSNIYIGVPVPKAAFDTKINGVTPIQILDAAYARQKKLASA